MTDKWRLLDTGKLTGAENMALDSVILQCRAEAVIPNTIRFLQFSPACVLVGYHQSVEQEVRIDYCKKHGIDINRRITGGGAILFTPTCLGWEIFADKTSVQIGGMKNDLNKLARFICEAAVSGLENLGIEAKFRAKNDIEVNGRKISGTGGTEHEEAFMYQGTLLIDFDVEMMLKALRIPVEKLQDKEIESVRDRVTCVKEELGFVPQISEIKQAMVSGFEETLNVKLESEGIYPREQDLYESRLPKMQSEDWIYSVRRPLDTAGQLTAIRKTPGGLLRVSLVLDIPGNFIVNSFITGDFQAFPSRAMMDLEAKLKSVSADESTISATVLNFFQESGTRVAGIDPEDFIDIIIEAVKKSRFVDYGLSLQEANHLMVVNFSPDELAAQHFDFVLLPYCAKLVGCDYRFREGCSVCGQCSTSSVFETIRDMGVPVRTIQNFEHLLETIHEFKTKGAKGYIGSCCEAFYGKHYRNFVQTGVPALLVDVDDSTCYDLGEEKKAYEGSFEGQTQLKEDLLIRIARTLEDRGILQSERK